MAARVSHIAVMARWAARFRKPSWLGDIPRIDASFISGLGGFGCDFFSYLVGDYLWLMIKYGYIMIYYCIWIRYMIRYYMILVNDYPAWKTLDIFGSFRYGKIHHAFFLWENPLRGVRRNPILYCLPMFLRRVWRNWIQTVNGLVFVGKIETGNHRFSHEDHGVFL